jgi:hypothetical protein
VERNEVGIRREDAADRRAACQAFDWINTTLFSGELPYPLIVLGLTPHGHALGFTRLSDTVPPSVTLHPSLWGGTEKTKPWGIAPDLLGPRYALDVLIHEAIHVSVHYRLGWRRPATWVTSHDNAAWVSEVNRIAPVIGLPGVEAAKKTSTRIGTTIRHVSKGNISHDALSRFPYAVREARGDLAYYRDRTPLPFET